MLRTVLDRVIEWLAPAIVIASACLIYFVPAKLDSLLHYDRSLIFTGDYWRIVTGHFTHTNLNHLLMNCAGVILAWGLLPIRPRLDLALFGLTILAGLCGLALLVFEPHIGVYQGLSGLTHALIALGAVLNISDRDSRWWGLFLMALLSLKVYSEWFGTSGSLIEQWTGAPAATEAHIWGLVIGTLVATTVLLGMGLGDLMTRALSFMRGQKSSG
ncbi:rhomboid family GlyGly-CTERM serine protease [Microbulbifer donghaiensis]|uniref:Rhomboid family GlyGly-CTERM serine protease n=1 Tax=Microbulbifer donghaiensis TaxID=494016 RepID=A0A1M4XH06_9GAMM|nr:rhombosortase [Microbulbifer donghaiensis]SHE92452.1 rhomboid family GlyGly-CTERM serine protease [Microbulbifer donghaiensis]